MNKDSSPAPTVYSIGAVDGEPERVICSNCGSNCIHNRTIYIGSQGKSVMTEWSCPKCVVVKY